MTDLRTAAQQALEALEALQGGCTDSNDGTVEAITVWCPEVIDVLRTALEQEEQEPVAWAVQGCSKLWRGEFAEIDAKAEAKRIGGTCVAYALYATPPAHTSADTKNTPPPEWELIKNILDEYGLDAIAFVSEWKAAQRPWQGLTDDDCKGMSAGDRVVAMWADRTLKDKNT
jgi:hypothetical protein